MNYYNENDPKAAAWLRELIRANLIAPGVVDERSILDVKANDLSDYVQCHFFAGIGGWSYALRLAGWPDDRPVWTGSCPCQPFSQAGKGLGEADERHLWPYFRNLIGEQGPPTIFGEQVASAAGRQWLAGVQIDMETLAYRTAAADLCAASVGAPHIRQRIYWVAISPSQQRFERSSLVGGQSHPADSHPPIPSGIGGMAHSQNGNWRSGERGAEEGTRSDGVRRGRPASDSQTGSMADATSTRCLGPVSESESQARDQARLLLPGEYCETSQLANPKSRGQRIDRRPPGEPRHPDQCQPPCQLGDPNQPGRLTRVPPATPDRHRGSAGSNGSPCFWEAFDLIPCRDGKARRIEPQSFPLAHGIPGRVGLLRGYGNAIVPQVAAEFIKAVEEST